MSFLILLLGQSIGRQSATAATAINTSAGKALAQAVNMSRADSTCTVFTPCGGIIATGPDTKVTSAPSAAQARAMAYPCLPDEWLDR